MDKDGGAIKGICHVICARRQKHISTRNADNSRQTASRAQSPFSVVANSFSTTRAGRFAPPRPQSPSARSPPSRSTPARSSTAMTTTRARETRTRTRKRRNPSAARRPSSRCSATRIRWPKHPYPSSPRWTNARTFSKAAHLLRAAACTRRPRR